MAETVAEFEAYGRTVRVEVSQYGGVYVYLRHGIDGGRRFDMPSFPSYGDIRASISSAIEEARRLDDLSRRVEALRHRARQAASTAAAELAAEETP